jgi:hypothetical protein
MEIEEITLTRIMRHCVVHAMYHITIRLIQNVHPGGLEGQPRPIGCLFEAGREDTEKEGVMKSYLLKNTDKFMEFIEKWSERLAWVAILLALIFIILPSLVTIWMR